ncbi:hypothetical protein LV84_01954 [Algoriphagus ratkowskyi]|uniref:4-amino-4-deoxy-L-arabinose transferase-like glycosyltransferase n=1 Tax=Algoriphagus ratkowskyi TaxID=57028 RepID=A0A2W7R7K5_9BACT|nr:hypothetical protein [Algoriphagus ratkowskyi]PZX56828.1 hypothetical protein LV84_01954 [Algoriphagus ratkowskyi]TXD79744.1 hypothetical protein ESW18_01025 [Algoriphagus ratkowskyi]
MNSLQPNPFLSKAQFSTFAVGVLFLLCYWFFGYDGITFSDDVYYLLAGENFWKGKMEVSDYHFSSRWGAYVPSGLIGHLFGFKPHRISLISLLSYGVCLLILVKVLPKSAPAWVLVLWFCTQVYFLHFLTKVYPDSLLALWTCLIPAAAVYRKNSPILAGILLVSALFIGFLTKETIIFLAPFPLLLFYYDWKKQALNPTFYFTLVLTGMALAALYLGYFWISFGDPLHRISSINAGHYISEYTYADKGFWSMLKRLTIVPIITFVERSYWAWIVFAIPGIALGLKSRLTPAIEFSLAFLCLFIGFWFMSSTLDFYNPIYLNPRHLIILVPILSILIALGWNDWKKSKKWKIYLIGLLLLGTGISLIQLDLKMAVFHLALTMGVRFANLKFYPIFVALVLIAPALIAIPFQQKLKQYDTLIETLNNEAQNTDSKGPIYTHSFLDFSKEVLLVGDISEQNSLIPLYKFPEDKAQFPDKLRLLIYDYYKHAYPEEQVDINAINDWLNQYYNLTETRENGNISLKEFVKK